VRQAYGSDRDAWLDLEAGWHHEEEGRRDPGEARTVKVQAHFVAESASFGADGTFTVYKGGITDLNATDWPALSRLAIVTRLELTHDEAAHLIELTLRFLHDEIQLGQARQPLAVKVMDPTKPVYVNSIAETNLVIPGPGKITIEAAVNEKRLPLLYLWAVQAGAPQP
jgi:hypothetical protein